MKLIGHDEDQVDIRISLEELILLRNALDEICNTMQFSEVDFQVILDSNRAQAEDLLLRLNAALERLKIPLR
jgi:hypothetical protein